MSFISNYISESAMEIAKEQGEDCPHFYDPKVLDKILTSEESERYLSDKHELQVIYRPDTKKVHIRCDQCCTIQNWNKPLSIACDRKFTKTEKIIKKQIADMRKLNSKTKKNER